MSKRKKFWIVFSGATVLLVVLILGGFVWVFDRLELVNEGHARPTFPFSRYSQDELNKMYPQNPNENVATTRTPEETHRMFVDKLKEGDLNGAVECCMVKKIQEEWKRALVEIKDGGKLPIMISDIDEIEKEMVLDTLATYVYVVEVDGTKYGNTMEFEKNSNGVWLMESL